MSFGSPIHSSLLNLYLGVEVLGHSICIYSTLIDISKWFLSSACVFKDVATLEK